MVLKLLIMILILSSIASTHSCENCEEQLLEIISKIHSNSENLEKSLKQKASIVLVLGDTGSGKSIFTNILCGAGFEIQKTGRREILKIKEGTQDCSGMKNGAQLIKAEPLYHYLEQQNLLLINFPGFKDSKGEIKELVIQMLFNKIVTKNRVKLVYVLQQILMDIPNKGIFIQEFQLIFKNQEFKFSDTGLLINQFSQDNIKEEDLVQDVKDQLFTITNDANQNNQQIMVIRRISNSNLLQIGEIRQKLLLELKMLQDIKLKPFKVERIQLISNYILQTSKTLTQQIYLGFQEEIKNQIVHQKLETLTIIKRILETLQYDAKQNVIKQYQKLFSVYEEITNLFNIQNQIKSETKHFFAAYHSFFTIYKFFEEFRDQIDGYYQCADKIKAIYNVANLLNEYNQRKMKLKDLELRMKKLGGNQQMESMIQDMNTLIRLEFEEIYQQKESKIREEILETYQQKEDKIRKEFDEIYQQKADKMSKELEEIYQQKEEKINEIEELKTKLIDKKFSYFEIVKILTLAMATIVIVLYCQHWGPHWDQYDCVYSFLFYQKS